jgi:hypothetical protein
MWWGVLGGVIYLGFIIWFIFLVKNAPLLDESDPDHPRFIYKPRKVKR